MSSKLIPQSIFSRIIWPIALGFFLGLSATFALTYLFFKQNKILLWYMSCTLCFVVGYGMSIFPYYYEGSIFRFMFFSVNNTVQLGVLICGLKMIQDLTGYLDDRKFHQSTLFATVGIVSCNISYFLPNQTASQGFFLIFVGACFMITLDCYWLIKKAVKLKNIDKGFLKIIGLLFIMSFIHAYPVTQNNVTFIYKLRVLNNLLFPVIVSWSLALFFSKSMKNYQLKQKEIERLLTEKQIMLENQNEYLTKKVDEQTFELRALNSTKDRLFLIIGHDLRSSLASIQELLALIENQEINQTEFYELLHYLQKNVDGTAWMLENLLEWALSQMKGMQPNPKMFDMNDVLEQTIELLKNNINKKEIELYVDMTKQPMVFADPNQIQVVIRNLLHNAIKFTPTNGKISVSAKVKKELFELKIKDSGIGMNTEDLLTIFSKPTVKQGTIGEKGTGLGLSLCHDLIKQNHGEIKIISEPLKGTTIEVLIPQNVQA